MSDFRAYSGEEFFTLRIPPRKFIVDNVIRDRDSVLIVGNEKSGKSLLIFQLICSMTSGHPFLDRFNVTKPVKVSYIQIEGELADSQDRFNRMIKVLDFDPNNFQLIFSPPINLQSVTEADKLIDTLSKHQPDVVILDPVYFAMAGSLSDDLSVRLFIGNLRILKDKLKCALGLVHHTHKIKFNKNGYPIIEGDEATFGSKFFKAWADHTIMFTHDKKRDVRVFSCATQRSGDIEESIQVRLVQPDPLFFQELDTPLNKGNILINILVNKPNAELTPDELMDISELKRNSFYNSLKEPLATGQIIKLPGRPVRYRLGNNNKPT